MWAVFRRVLGDLLVRLLLWVLLDFRSMLDFCGDGACRSHAEQT